MTNTSLNDYCVIQYLCLWYFWFWFLILWITFIIDGCHHSCQLWTWFYVSICYFHNSENMKASGTEEVGSATAAPALHISTLHITHCQNVLVHFSNLPKWYLVLRMEKMRMFFISKASTTYQHAKVTIKPGKWSTFTCQIQQTDVWVNL